MELVIIRNLAYYYLTVAQNCRPIKSRQPAAMTFPDQISAANDGVSRRGHLHVVGGGQGSDFCLILGKEPQEFFGTPLFLGTINEAKTTVILDFLVDFSPKLDSTGKKGNSPK